MASGHMSIQMRDQLWLFSSNHKIYSDQFIVLILLVCLVVVQGQCGYHQHQLPHLQNILWGLDPIWRLDLVYHWHREFSCATKESSVESHLFDKTSSFARPLLLIRARMTSRSRAKLENLDSWPSRSSHVGRGTPRGEHDVPLLLQQTYQNKLLLWNGPPHLTENGRFVALMWTLLPF